MAKRILVVDDDPTQRRILEETIKRLGYQTTTASDGEEALSKLEQSDNTEFSLVLLDLVMPGLSGQEVLERLRTRAGSPPLQRVPDRIQHLAGQRLQTHDGGSRPLR